MTVMVLCLTQDPEADALLTRSPLALLVGMLLDQQIRMESAFVGPAKLLERLGHLDPASIAAMDPEAFGAVMAARPAVHRFHASMGQRIQALCRVIADDYGSDASQLWAGVATGEELLARVQALPGFGHQKAQIFVALLGKRLAVRPKGWRAAAGPYGDRQFRSVADVTSQESIRKVRAFKQAVKAEAKPVKN